MDSDTAAQLRERLGLDHPVPVEWRVGDSRRSDGITRQTIHYTGREGDPISAFLFLPPEERILGGIVVFHQHSGEFHLGKSEVAGDAGDPLQAFGPALAGRGVAVLAPDAITFEDRRASATGVEPDDDDWLQHYNAMAYRLVNGDVLMRKCLDDAQRAVSVLAQHPALGGSRPGVFGHSYGGTTALYLAAVDPRCRFAGVSGAVCSFQGRQRRGTGLNMFELVPGIARTLEVHDLLRAIGPRRSLVVSATEDPYSVDADEVVERAASEHVTHLRVQGGHALDQARFDAIVEWLASQAASTA